MRRHLESACTARPLPAPSGGAEPVGAPGGAPRPDWLARVARLRGRRHPWWLDSALAGGRLGRFSFAGADPWAVVRAFGRRVVVDVLRPAVPGREPGRRVRLADPLDVLAEWLPPAPPHPTGGAGATDDPGAALPFRGGAVGLLGYELAPLMPPLEPLVLRGLDDTGLPDLAFLLVDRGIARDHATGACFAFGLGVAPTRAGAERRAAEAAEAIAAATSAGAPDPDAPSAAAGSRATPVGASAARVDPDESAHAKAVERIRAHIAEGDCYQACLTHRHERPAPVDAFALHARLREASPAPFAACLELPGFAVVSSSPERFLRVGAGGAAESRPIKGTRPRHPDPATDDALARALAASEKDRAENLMIVDLVRNDLGRVCEPGSLRVPELFAVERYADVHQLVSTVTGRLRAGQGVLDAIRATFPPGSMTGAPKLAAMEILERLEPVRRGFYAGALGYLDVSGACDLSVVIRSVFLVGGRALVHSGGGIVADSEPAAEWAEAADKVAGLLAVLDAGAPEPPGAGSGVGPR